MTVEVEVAGVEYTFICDVTGKIVGVGRAEE